MKMRALCTTAAAVSAGAFVLTLTHVASAWDSICYQYQDTTKKVTELTFVPNSRGCQGVEAARGRFRDPEKLVDEHRRGFELAAQQAGLPASALDTVKLAVLSGPSANLAIGGNGATSSIDLVSPASPTRGVFRAYAFDELAQLPDFSYALWDWARGNETCPLIQLSGSFGDPHTCHLFESHMGATNSNHFPPQSDNWFTHYHSLAVGRAQACRDLRNQIWNLAPAAEQQARDARFATFYKACEIEALTYEAVAQHYLQDSWSAGHMWQRWGSTYLDHFPVVDAVGTDPEDLTWNALDDSIQRLLVAEIVAVSAGTIHGSDPPLFEEGVTSHDALCYPDDDVQALDGANLIHVVGDLHMHDVVGAPPAHSDISSGIFLYDVSQLQSQAQKLLGCSAGAIGQVYTTLTDDATFGSPVLGPKTGDPPMFNATACQAPRVTNRAMHEGIDATDTFPAVGEALAVLVGDIPDSIESTARNDYGKVRHAAWVASKLPDKANTTELANFYIPSSFEYNEQFCDELQNCQTFTYKAAEGLYTMLSVEPNACYTAAGGPGCSPVNLGANDPLAPFIDPELPAQLMPPAPDDHAGALALAFHASRAPQLCNAITAANLSAIPAIVTNAETTLERAAACDACAEWIAPFLRIGKDAQSYDTNAQPLCYYTASDPNAVPYVYEAGTGTTDTLALARRRCGCRNLVAVTNAGLQRLETTPSANSMQFNLQGPAVPVGNLPRDLAPASEGRLLVSNGNGQIVGVREGAEVDLDGNDANGITRLTFSGVSDIQGLAVVNVAAKELILAATPGTGELIVYDLTTHTQCDRFSVAQVAGQGAYDVVVANDLTKVWISLRQVSPLSGALASVSLPAIAACDGSALATRQWLAPPGAASGLGPMALSPDGTRLAVGGRLASTCLDQIKSAGGATVDTQVGCDRVYVLDVPTNTWKTFGNQLSMPSRPGRYPYSVAWFDDSLRMVFATFQGIDNLGSGDSGWPAQFAAVPRIPIGGTLRLTDTSNPSFEGGGGVAGPRYWTYNLPLQSNVIGETVVVDGGTFYGNAWVYVATSSGRVSAYSVAPHLLASPDPMWEGSPADPETALHLSTNGAWYGGCRHSCSLVGNACPDVCGQGTIPAGFGSIELGSSVRVLKSF
ncbi:MAG: hypothetical protein IPK82_16810 [Polyangiaceae bacterium]|nr:hypothetical protein [Polyangiaceae bacterium]